MNLKPPETNDPIYISRLMNAYALLSKQGKQRVRIIFKMIFEDEDSWQKPDTLDKAAAGKSEQAGERSVRDDR